MTRVEHGNKGMLTIRRFIVEAILKHVIDEDVSPSRCAFVALAETDIALGYSQVPGQMGRLRGQERSDLGARGESRVSTHERP